MKGLRDTILQKFRVLLSSEAIKMLEQARLLFCNILFSAIGCGFFEANYTAQYVMCKKTILID
ncbi:MULTISPECIES: hypothetical protein [unclassified Bartonella]|uniref:hypothetical protein n=1 Tax=unclassified Bartonella TaxID=2645622 RepID=UPI0035CE987B